MTEIESRALTVLDEHIASIQRIVDTHIARIARRNGVGVADDRYAVELYKRDIRTLKIARGCIVEALGITRA